MLLKYLSNSSSVKPKSYWIGSRERAALIKRIDEARQNTAILSGNPPPIQDGGEHMANQNALGIPFQQLQRQVQELLDWESPADGL